MLLENLFKLYVKICKILLNLYKIKCYTKYKCFKHQSTSVIAWLCNPQCFGFKNASALYTKGQYQWPTREPGGVPIVSSINKGKVGLSMGAFKKMYYSLIFFLNCNIYFSMFENIYTPAVYIYYVIIIFPDPLPPPDKQ